jgi:hypothetical protein
MVCVIQPKKHAFQSVPMVYQPKDVYVARYGVAPLIG